ncbi:MAG: PAS domain S-box protein [Nitrospirae bacterium]|nr:PAS domain S-box protein [Nitrospirota bacterium]
MEELSNKLKKFMAIRVIAVTFFLGSFLFLGIKYKEGPFLIPTFYSLIATTYLFTLIYAVLFNRVSSKVSTYIQLFGDLILITVLVAASDGIESPFVFLYLFSIIPASIMLYRTGAMTAASAASILYGLIADIQFYNIVPFMQVTTLSAKAFFYVLSLHITAFFAVAYLSSSAVETLRRMREELREKSSNLVELQTFNANVAQCMSTGLLTTDEGGRITSFNRAAEEITGYKWEEVKGRPYIEIIPAKKLEDILHKPEDILPIYRFESEMPRKDRVNITLGLNVSRLKDEAGHIRGVIGIFQDLTKIKEMEMEVKKREKMAMIGELAAGMAHEIRNPLASLSGSMQILKQELSLDEDHNRLMNIALREMDRLNKTITDFLIYAKPIPLQKRVMNINDLLIDAIELLKNSEALRSSDISLQTEFKEDSIMASIDPHQISQVFWNLSLNAVQAMSKKGAEGGVFTISSRKGTMLEISEKERSGIKEWVEIIFKDTGEGIDEKILDKIFVPFYTTKENGSGLGLSIVHRVIEEHGGRIFVKSKPGKGTQFTLYIPAE